jgi:hypothetical protein
MKQYEALAFVQYLETCLQQRIFVPPYLELTLQETVIGQFLHESHHVQYQRGRTLEGINWQDKDLVYSFTGNRELAPVEKIAAFLLKRIRPFKQRFETLREEVRQHIAIERVGISPFYCNEGWLLLGRDNNIDVYAFKDAVILDARGSKTIETTYYTSYQRSAINTPEHIKLDLVKQHRQLPNPATYFVNYVSTYPLETTYLPLVREKLAHQEWA